MKVYDCCRNSKESNQNNETCEATKLKSLRDKLLYKNKIRASKIWKMLMLCLCVDIVLTALFAQISSHLSSIPYSIRLLDIYNDTLDCCFSILIRWLLVYLLTNLLIKYGHPDRYRNLDELKNNKPKEVKLILLIWKYLFMASSQNEIIFQKSDTFQATSILSLINQKNRKRSIIDTGDVLNKYQYYNQYEIAYT